MTGNSTRRALMALACATAALLAACGSGDIQDPVRPTRFLAVGDGFSDLGQSGSRYTVNDGSINIWSQQLAASYGLTLVASDKGGLSYARGNALVSGPAPSIESQVNTLLASNTYTATDVVLLNGGLTDLVANVKALGISSQTTANVQAAGKALGAQVRRLVNAGFKYVVVTGVYNLGNSPWGVALGQGPALADLSNAFNDAFKVSIVDLGANVRYLDAAQYLNQVYNSPTSYAPLNNVTTVACTTALVTECTPSTIAAGADYNTLMFASDVYPSPTTHRLLGSQAYSILIGQW